MPAIAMNHFTILTDNVKGTLAFYAEMLDLHPGARPPFRFPGAWLYARDGKDPILHVIGGKPTDTLVKGVIDHMAFTGKDLAGMVAKLKGPASTTSCAACPTTARGSSSSTIRTTPRSRSTSILRNRKRARSFRSKDEG